MCNEGRMGGSRLQNTYIVRYAVLRWGTLVLGGNDLVEMYDSEPSKAEEELAEDGRKNGGITKLPSSTYEERARRGVCSRSGRGARFLELQKSRVQGAGWNDLVEMY